MTVQSRLIHINNLVASLPCRFISKRARRDYNLALEELNELVRLFEENPPPCTCPNPDDSYPHDRTNTDCYQNQVEAHKQETNRMRLNGEL